jgi:hypothetical protein
MKPSKGPNDIKDKARNFLNRFPFTDLAIAVARTGSKRENFLRYFVETSTTQSYKWVREAAGLIYPVTLPLFPTPVLSWKEIENSLRNAAPPHTVEINVDAGKELFDLVRPRGYKAYQHDENVLRIGHNQIVSIGLNFYIVEGDRLAFQYPQPRAQAVFDNYVAAVMMSIIHHAYVFGDYADAEVELADLSAEEPKNPWSPRIRRIGRNEIIGRDELTKEIEDVYAILRALAGEKFKGG